MTAKKCTETYNARVERLFLFIRHTVWWRFRCRRRRLYLSSLNSFALGRPRFLRSCFIFYDCAFIRFLFAVINKDVTAEEVQRLDDLVTYLEEQDSQAQLQKQVR